MVTTNSLLRWLAACSTNMDDSASVFEVLLSTNELSHVAGPFAGAWCSSVEDSTLVKTLALPAARGSRVDWERILTDAIVDRIGKLIRSDVGNINGVVARHGLARSEQGLID